jgi:hypothetical protein
MVFSQNADFEEALQSIPESARSSKMANLPRPVPATRLLLPTTPNQLSIAFETIPLREIPQAERTKVIAHLAKILLQAAGAAMGERDDDEQ